MCARLLQRELPIQPVSIIGSPVLFMNYFLHQYHNDDSHTDTTISRYDQRDKN